jgi:hypothetical protein
LGFWRPDKPAASNLALGFRIKIATQEVAETTNDAANGSLADPAFVPNLTFQTKVMDAAHPKMTETA